MKDYLLLQRWAASTESVFKDVRCILEDDTDMINFGVFNSLEELMDELEYRGLGLKEILQLTRNRYGNVIEILEYNSRFYMFIGENRKD